MAVAPSHRSQGLGSLLLRRVHEWAASQGIGFVSLSVMAGNEEAERFYRRFGMERSVVRMLGPVPSCWRHRALNCGNEGTRPGLSAPGLSRACCTVVFPEKPSGG